MTGKYGGSGLGLSIVKKLVDLRGSETPTGNKTYHGGRFKKGENGKQAMEILKSTKGVSEKI